MADNAITIEQELAPILTASGLGALGWLVMADAPFAMRKALLIGNHAVDGKHTFWEIFSQSPEYGDGMAEPMNRWTERVVGDIARQRGAVALYPFGQTLWPFQRYAQQATGMKASPLGILIHPEFGLWHAFRALLVFGSDVALSPVEKLIHPCERCIEKPCLSACPVNAFSDTGFAVSACREHLASGDEPRCMALGCRARAACPVGVPYSEAQIRFHMEAFA
jgi:hypothetical protein